MPALRHAVGAVTYEALIRWFQPTERVDLYLTSQTQLHNGLSQAECWRWERFVVTSGCSDRERCVPAMCHQDSIPIYTQAGGWEHRICAGHMPRCKTQNA